MGRVWYLAGPYRGKTGSEGEILHNVGQAILAGARLTAAGHNVIVPHLSWYLDRQTPSKARQSDEWWLGATMELSRRTDGLVVLQGYSEGTRAEVEEAKQRGVPILTVEELLERGVDE